MSNFNLSVKTCDRTGQNMFLAVISWDIHLIFLHHLMEGLDVD